MTVFGTTPLGPGRPTPGSTVSPFWTASAWASSSVRFDEVGTVTWTAGVVPGPDSRRKTRRPTAARMRRATIPAAQTAGDVPPRSSSSSSSTGRSIRRAWRGTRVGRSIGRTGIWLVVRRRRRERRGSRRGWDGPSPSVRQAGRKRGCAEPRRSSRHRPRPPGRLRPARPFLPGTPRARRPSTRPTTSDPRARSRAPCGRSRRGRAGCPDRTIDGSGAGPVSRANATAAALSRLPRPMAREELVEDDPERVDVGRGGRLVAAGLLRAEVVDGAERRAREGHLGLGNRPGDAEIGHLDVPIAVDHDVAGLDVAMDDPGAGARRAGPGRSRQRSGPPDAAAGLRSA